MVPTGHKKSFLHQHSLSIVTILVLGAWIVLYKLSDPATHLGSFFGNAIADWSGVLVTVLATKYFYEKGSAESRRPPHPLLRVGTLDQSLAHNLPSDHRSGLGNPLCTHEFGSQVGPGGGKHRLGVDAGLSAGAYDQTLHREAFQRE